MTDWNPNAGYADFGIHRTLNYSTRVVLHVGTDAFGLQEHQTEGLPGELRNNQQRVGEVGFASMPLPGAVAAVMYQGGGRHFASIVGVEDPRYRPVGLNPGEVGVYMVDGASGNGVGGTMRWLMRGLLGWINNITGKTINIGTMADTVTITITGQTINIVGNAGDVVINGVSLVHHVHSNAGGTGDSGPPVAS